jgi:hypothetical protein
MNQRPHPRGAVDPQVLVNRLIRLVGREIAELEARYDQREAARRKLTDLRELRDFVANLMQEQEN